MKITESRPSGGSDFYFTATCEHCGNIDGAFAGYDDSQLPSQCDASRRVQRVWQGPQREARERRRANAHQGFWHNRLASIERGREGEKG